jgi:hypothetical protein
MGVPLYRRDSRTLDPNLRISANPQGLPKPTGRYPENWGERSRDYVSDHDVLDYAGRCRTEYLSQFEYVDQHPFVEVSATWTPVQGERKDGRHDPLQDGPPAPVVRLLQLFYQRAQGTSTTRFMDVPGRQFPVAGSQDGASWIYYQDARTAMQPLDENGRAPDSLRSLPPSPPHGWTSRPVINATQAETRKSATLRQQQTPHQDRLAPSTAAGQTYSARTARVGQGQQQTGSIPSWRPRG